MKEQKDDLNVERHLKGLVIKALTRARGNRRKTAALLGVAERTLYNWIVLFNLRDFYPANISRQLERMQ